MLDRLLSIIAPHHCLSCGKLGRGLCLRCKNNLSLTPSLDCMLCRARLSNERCRNGCRLHGVRQSIVTQRTGVIRELLHGMKFKQAREHTRVCADLLNEAIDDVDPQAYVVPIPTSVQHVRQRGFDHTRLIARRFAHLRGLSSTPLLWREHNHRQVGSNRIERFKQADTAFRVTQTSKTTRPLILLDDIVTTGATMAAAKECLETAGYTVAHIIAVAYQPLDETEEL